MLLVYLQIASAALALIVGAWSYIGWIRCQKAERELNRWRVYWHDTRRRVSEFSDVADALDYLKAEADGTEASTFSYLRDRMRRRRDATVPETSKPADFSSSESKSSSSGGGGGSDGGCSKSIALKIGAGGASCYDGRNSK